MLLEQLAFHSKDSFKTALDRFCATHEIKQVGEGGTHAFVLDSGKSYVWRCWFNDQGYESFIKYVAAHPNDAHLPRILGKVRQAEASFKRSPKLTLNYVRLEKLTPCVNELSHVIDLMYLHSIGYGLSSLAELQAACAKQEEGEAMLAALKKYPLFFETYVDLCKVGANDINKDNVMMRGNVPVIIDPFSHG